MQYDRATAVMPRYSPFLQQHSDAVSSDDALLQQQIRDVLLLDSSPNSSLQVEQIQQALLRQAQQPLGQISDALVPSHAGSAMQQTLQQAFEQHSAPQRAALHSTSARPAHSSGALMPVNPGALAFAHSATAASASPSLALSSSSDAEAYRSVAAVDAQLDALHESLRRFKFARMGQAMEFRAALPEAAPAFPAAAPQFNSRLRGQPQLLHMQQHARLLPPQPQQPTPSWPSTAPAAVSSLSPDSYPSSGLGATAASAYSAHAVPQHHAGAASYGYLAVPAPGPAVPSAASISVIHSPAGTLTRSLHPQQPTQSQLQQQQQQYSAFRQPTPPLSLDQQWMQQQALSQQYAHLLSPNNALGASAPHTLDAASAAHVLHTRPDSGHRSARTAGAVR